MKDETGNPNQNNRPVMDVSIQHQADNGKQYWQDIGVAMPIKDDGFVYKPVSAPLDPTKPLFFFPRKELNEMRSEQSQSQSQQQNQDHTQEH